MHAVAPLMPRFGPIGAVRFTAPMAHRSPPARERLAFLLVEPRGPSAGPMVIVEPVQPDVTGVNGRPLASINPECERDGGQCCEDVAGVTEGIP